jgi:ABC-type multidrug transport system permease subunit
MTVFRDRSRFIKNFRRFSLLLTKWLAVIMIIKLYSETLVFENVLLATGFLLLISIIFGFLCSLYVEFKDDKP